MHDPVDGDGNLGQCDDRVAVVGRVLDVVPGWDESAAFIEFELGGWTGSDPERRDGRSG
jgi:hypothetical protein